MHEATFKLVLTQRQYMLVAHIELLLKLLKDSGYFLNTEKHFY